MMYTNKFACAIKANGHILREYNDTVYVPFGQEYTIYLKNLNSKRAQVKISIDGEDALNGSALVVGSNQSIDLERYLKDMNKGNKFKFIERTSNIEKHRGVKAEDGLIRIEFAFEKISTPIRLLGGTWNGWPGNNYPFNGYPGAYYSSTVSSVTSGDLNANNSIASASLTANSGVLRSMSMKNDAGITVKGSISDQKFATVYGFETEPSEVIVFKLVGDTGQTLVTKPVTVNHKVECVTCGRTNKVTAKFCSECGTALESAYA